MTNARTALLEARTRRDLTRFSIRFEQVSACGYILDVGPKFILVAIVNDRIHFDGYECFRVSDVSKVRPEPHTHFVESALKKRGEKQGRKPRIDLTSEAKILASAAKLFPTVTVHRELVDPNVCFIGKLVDVENGKFSLLLVDTDGRWLNEIATYRLSELTRIGFGQDYEQALHLVSGNPPKAAGKQVRASGP